MEIMSYRFSSKEQQNLFTVFIDKPRNDIKEDGANFKLCDESFFEVLLNSVEEKKTDELSLDKSKPQ